MGTVALLFRIVLAAMFAVAGVAKLADLERSRKAVRDFGLPDWAANPLGLLLPLAELSAAVLLIPISTVFWGSAASIGLLVAFIIGIVINLSLGRTPECNCFGQVSSEPIGWSTVVRNAVLTALAGFVLWDFKARGPVSLWGTLTGMSGAAAAILILSIAVVVVAAGGIWLALHLLRQHGHLLLRVDALETQLGESGVAPKPVEHVGLPLGAVAPHFELPQLGGEAPVTLQTLLAEKKPVALIFSDPGCGPCTGLLPDIARWEREHAQKLTVAIVSRGTREANEKKIGDHAIRYVLLQKEREVADAYQSKGTPGAVLVGADGKIASAVALGPQAVASLIATSPERKRAFAVPSRAANGNGAGTAQAAPALPIGTPAPAVVLPDLNGKTVELASYKGKTTVVLFWNPGCGFCAKMLPDLKRWEEERSPELPELLVVSTGTVEANRAMGLRSTIMLDQGFNAGKAFQVRGTPSAIMVDAEGRIASDVGVGSPAVLALANSRQQKPALSPESAAV